MSIRLSHINIWRKRSGDFNEGIGQERTAKIRQRRMAERPASYIKMLSDTELDHIAKLARVTVAPEKKEQLKKDLSAILGYIEKLNKANTSSVEPLYQTTGLVNATRSDEPRGEFPMTEKLEELLIGQAPTHKERFVKVKSILGRK